MIFVLLVSHFYTKVGNLKEEFMCPHPPGGGGGNSNVKKDTECSSKTLERIPKRYPDPVLWAWLENFLTPNLEGVTNSYITHYLLSYFLA